MYAKTNVNKAKVIVNLITQQSDDRRYCFETIRVGNEIFRSVRACV